MAATTDSSHTADRLLDAYCTLLLEGGEKAATLDAVAHQAGVSKGGLLYHFGSKAALAAGVLDRVARFVADDVTAMTNAPEGPVAYFIRTSTDEGTEFDIAINALVALAQSGDADALSALADVRRQWRDALMTEVEDSDAAYALLFLSDGLYLASAMPDSYPDIDRENDDDFAARMLRVARRLARS